MIVKINCHGDQNLLPVAKGDWIDLFTANEVMMLEKEFALISLGISVQIPKGYTAYLLPRSSTYKKYGIICANSMGVIDNEYCGDDDILQFAAIATRNIIIPQYTRICQLGIMKSPEPVQFKQVKTLGNPSRGGFGSTGTN